MSAVVTRSSPVLVRPSSEPTDSSHIDLSSVDGCYACLPVTCVLVLEHPIDDPVETIKKALSQALVHYGPIAGRLADDRRRIACTGEGVSFLGASASCALQLSTLKISDLAPQYAGELCGHSEPLLLMQVTEFSCGGFTVAVTWNHAAADAEGMAQFLQAVGELARGMPAPSVVPVRSCGKEKLPVIPAATVALHRSTMELVGVTKHLAALDFTVPGSLIRRIKAQHGCTVYEAVAAVLWRCRTRAAIADDPEAAAPLAIPCNARRHLGTETGYYGNCLAMAFVNATAGAVADGEMGDLLRLIRSAKEKVHHPQNMLLATPSTVDETKALMYNASCVVSWRNLGFDGADFGHGGTPARVMWHMEHVPVTFCAVCPPCKGVDGVNIMSRCLWPEHVDAFLAELASM